MRDLLMAGTSCFPPKGMAAAKQPVGHDHRARSQDYDLKTSVKGGLAGIILGSEISASSPPPAPVPIAASREAEAQIVGHDGKSRASRRQECVLLL